MSKITNLIGTTWRLDGREFVGLLAGYGIFNINYSGNLAEYVANEYSDGIEYSATVIYCGYSNAQTPIDACVLVPINMQGTPFNYPITSVGDGNYTITEFTITGGTDISNPLFIDFINTYGTLVSGGEPPTAEGVKSKLQSLITASNAKTGKSDANLTDAVKTLLEGYGQGEDSPLPIEVATADEMTALLETAEVGAIYKYTGETTDNYENGALYVVEESE